MPRAQESHQKMSERKEELLAMMERKKSLLSEAPADFAS